MALAQHFFCHSKTHIMTNHLQDNKSNPQQEKGKIMDSSLQNKPNPAGDTPS